MLCEEHAAASSVTYGALRPRKDVTADRSPTVVREMFRIASKCHFYFILHIRFFPSLRTPSLNMTNVGKNSLCIHCWLQLHQFPLTCNDNSWPSRRCCGVWQRPHPRMETEEDMKPLISRCNLSVFLQLLLARLKSVQRPVPARLPRHWGAENKFNFLKEFKNWSINVNEVLSFRTSILSLAAYLLWKTGCHLFTEYWSYCPSCQITIQESWCHIWTLFKMWSPYNKVIQSSLFWSRNIAKNLTVFIYHWPAMCYSCLHFILSWLL